MTPGFWGQIGELAKAVYEEFSGGDLDAWEDLDADVQAVWRDSVLIACQREKETGQ